MAEKIVQTAGRNQLGEFAPMFAHLNDDVLFGEVWNETTEAVTEKDKYQNTIFFPIGEENPYGEFFVGQSYLAPVSKDQVPVFNVTFEPGCRNNWHIHHAKSGGGQMLICVGGRGYYQEWGKEAVEMTPGKVINIPAEVKHWHGAAPDSWFSHLAIEVAGEEAGTEWLEAVSDEDYGKLKQEADATQNMQIESSVETENTNNTEEAEQTVTGEDALNATDEIVEDTSSEATESSEEDGGTLVVYFSATGTTKGVAEKIAGITGADTYEIKAAQEYTDADLNWNDSSSRSTKEQNDSSARPEIGSDAVSLDGYTTIYIGYPIWWGEEPRIMDTFVENYSFDGITMIPFCTSSSSGIGRSGQNLADNAGSGTWLEGKRFGGGASEDEIKSWIEGLQ